MNKLFQALGALQVLASVFAFTSAAGAMHEVFAAILLGSGVIAIALGCIIYRQDRQVALLSRIADAQDRLAR